MRVRVKLDVRQPLKRGKKLKKEGGEWFLVEYAYERLPTFCFVCGVLGHGERFCPIVLRNWGAKIERNYGPEMRASGRKMGMGIGAKWLREELPVRGKDGVKVMASDNSWDGRPHNSCRMMNEGFVSKKMLGQSSVQKDPLMMAPVEGNTLTEATMEEQGEDGLVFVDPKKRKTLEGVNANGSYGTIMDVEPKNLSEAGSGCQTRRSE
ncbi:unnamed protein product [Cuscuta campestris]|uniref:Zinc knuckle CX2CX4HX4C domain-containing protein n=1 Tax=Cuscuta campestris TaxID=132261 RepID=A0A484N272_9ASTE|nr:unnamed protein product [Cuscuta campestris]